MNTSALKSFAQQSRKLLREGVERRVIYWGFEKNGKNTAEVEAVAGGYTFRGKVNDDNSVPSKWNKLKAAIAQTSFDEVVEKAAYTWFNRLLAVKILGKNGYEASQVDYLNEETNTPAILERGRRGQYSFLQVNEKKQLQALLTDYEKEQEAFATLLIGYCHQHPLLNAIFGSIDDYTELLLPDDIIAKNGFLDFLNSSNAISDEDYKQVELIGWLYQFYISEKKDEIFAGFKKNKKAEAKDIPAATQIFTPNWIVKYLVQNTLGRSWLDVHLDSDLKKDWRSLVEPSDITSHSEERCWNGTSEELTFLDPAVGSGHILVEAFEVLYPMYVAEYYSPEEAVQNILEKNLFGLDLDLRAAQLAQFAIILKAAQYNRKVLQGITLPHVYAMPQHRIFGIEEVALFLGKENAVYIKQLYAALQVTEQAHNLGSIMVLELSEDARIVIKERHQYWQKKTAANFEEEIIKGVFPAYISILVLLTNKFASVAANPPYMGQKNMNAALKNYVNSNYPNSKSDLFAVFMDVCKRLLHKKGRYGMINQHSWMFLSSYETLREQLLVSQTIENMLHLGPRTFDEISGEVVQNTAFVLKNEYDDSCKGRYYRLVAQRGSEEKYNAFNKRLNDFNNIRQANFSKIPGSPIAYWVNESERDLYKDGMLLGNAAFPRKGLDTGENEIFLRQWTEVSYEKLSIFSSISKAKWFPYNKGGEFRRWYGNREYVINWQNDGAEIKARLALSSKKPTIRNASFYFREGFSWTTVAGGGFSARFIPTGCLFDNGGCTLFADEDLYYYGGLLNSVIGDRYLEFLSPTLNFQPGDIGRILLIVDENQKESISQYVNDSIKLAKAEWDSREISWDFKMNPLIAIHQPDLQQSYKKWQQIVSRSFFQLHANEEELNRIFIGIYGLQHEVSPSIPLKDIALLKNQIDEDALEKIESPFEQKLVPLRAEMVMQQLLSYIVGCYMGRYRLDKPGLHIAHPNPKEDELSPYPVHRGANQYFQFQIDDDAIIPLIGNKGNFTDDMLHKVKEFLTIVWGDTGLTANLNFLQQQLGRDLEDFLLKDFWKYHVKTYSKKPIYWLFASKNGAFQVLVYMHRMNIFTLAKIRSKYLIPHISWLQNVVTDMEKKAATLSRAELKKLDTNRKQLRECEVYDLLLKNTSDKQISFDLNDGVTKNYSLFKGVVAEIK